ncbi:MAG: HaeIII family restriction endonuclease [Flavobacteriales bacterium]|nr:HaeIII family restriction endonuclease [Flavobacteriales bacterium]
MASQTINGKAFEYALLTKFHDRLSLLTDVNIIKNEPLNRVIECFDKITEEEQNTFKIAASFAVNFLIDLEPRLSVAINNKDILILEIVSDSAGKTGDVRDVLCIRTLQKWEIGISAKNNHRALKHSRLSTRLDFGKEWVGLPCSKDYFDEINKVFSLLTSIRKEKPKTKWGEVFKDKNEQIYKPVLMAFRKELLSLQKIDPENFAHNVVQYLVGSNDFYKIIKNKRKVEIQAFNMNGRLNLPAKGKKPELRITKVQLPKRLIELVFKKGHDNTLIASFDEGWQISFRLHTAKSTVEPSLKFDVNLISAPYNLFSHHMLIKQ